MTSKFHLGQRVSFQRVLCTVRYIGLVDGTEKEWLGVEWDDPLRGKHDGELKGKRYFTCKSISKTAASFVRPNRAADFPQSFVEAVHRKYATDEDNSGGVSILDTIHVISGKVVEEVGFDKIRHQLSQLQDLKIVIVDGACIATAEDDELKIRDVCPKIVELDLSRNLFERFQDVVDICGQLDNLKSLRINGNRFSDLALNNPEECRKKLLGITDLELDDVLMSWDDICSILQYFPSLTKLEASSNLLTSITKALPTTTLKSLTLEYNNFTTLADLAPLASLETLEVLLLKGNHISSTGSKYPVFGPNLHYIDLSYNGVTQWSLVDTLPSIFPGITALRFAHNPIYEASSLPKSTSVEENFMKTLEEGYMLTLARIAQLKTLNFSTITTADRTNAEMYYLSCIGKEIGSSAEEKEKEIVSRHPRYHELVELYGEPNVVRISKESVNPNFLEARLIKFNFYMSDQGRDVKGDVGRKEKMIEIPKSFDVYRVKGIVGRAFGVAPLSLKLTWETGEWDPVAGYEDEVDSSDDDEDAVEDSQEKTDEHSGGAVQDDEPIEPEKGKWMKREVVIEDGTRQIGFWVDGMEAIVRVELRSI